MSVSPLRFEIHRYGVLRQKLLEAFPEADDETIRDTLEGITTLNELVAEIIRSALIDEGLQKGLRSRMDDMKERLSRLEHREASASRATKTLAGITLLGPDRRVPKTIVNTGSKVR